MNEDLIRDYLAGVPVPVLLERYGVRPTKMYHQLSEAGISRRGQGTRRHPSTDSACRAYADGMAVEEIVQTFGVSTTSLYRSLRRLGVPRRDDKQKRKARMIEMFEAGASLTEVSKAVGITIRSARKRALELGFRAPRSTPEKRGPVVGQIWERGTRRIRIIEVGRALIRAVVLPDEREWAVFTIKGLLFGYRLIGGE